MATTDTLFILTPQGGVPPATLFATLDTITELSTPNAIISVLDFDGSADEHRDWWVTVPSHYAGGGFTFSYKYAMSGTDGSAVEMEFRVMKLQDSDDLSSDLNIDGQTEAALADTPIATADDLNLTATVELSHANADSPAVGDRIVIRATRDISPATNTDDLQLLEILVLET